MSPVRWLIVGMSMLLVLTGMWQCTSRSSQASETMDGITVKGPAEFRGRTREALDALDVSWHAFVTRWLSTVVYDEGQSRRNGLAYVNVISATFHVTQEAAFGYDDSGYAGDSIAWYACGLVHEAQHVYQFKYSKLRHGREAEYDAISAQVVCLKKLGASGFMLDYADQLRECIHADGCKYWEEHRRW